MATTCQVPIRPVPVRVPFAWVTQKSWNVRAPCKQVSSLILLRGQFARETARLFTSAPETPSGPTSREDIKLKLTVFAVAPLVALLLPAVGSAAATVTINSPSPQDITGGAIHISVSAQLGPNEFSNGFGVKVKGGGCKSARQFFALEA
jgi:hypothetical protein